MTYLFLIDRYYKVGSLWRTQDHIDTNLLIEESQIVLSHLNEYPFNLKADFEYLELVRIAKEKEEQDGFKLERQPQDVDMEAFTFE